MRLFRLLERLKDKKCIKLICVCQTSLRGKVECDASKQKSLAVHQTISGKHEKGKDFNFYQSVERVVGGTLIVE